MQASANFTKSIHICIFINIKDRLVPSSELAESMKTNPVVVRRLITLLRKHNIIESVAGARGGFRLTRPADKITLWDIYLAVREEQFFNRPKVNPDCIVSSNLAILVHDSFNEAELSMKPALEKQNVSSLSKELHKIVGDKVTTEA